MTITDNALCILQSAVRRAVDDCPVCHGTGLVTRTIPSGEVQAALTHCDWCTPLKDALRRAESLCSGSGREI